MNHSIKRKIIATLLASAMVLPVAFGGCKPKDEGSGDEWTITLNYNDGVSRNHHIYVDKEGGTVKMPDEPLRDGYTFDGWYTEEEGGEKVDLSTLTSSDKTVYAHWAKAAYTVTFDFNYDDKGTYETATAEYGGKVAAPATNPEREGYIFRYWSTTADGTSRVEFDEYTVTGNVTLYAKWRDENIKVYDVVLVYNNGTNQKAEYEVEHGKRLSKTNASKAERKGYTLVGYSTDPEAKPTDASVIKISDFPYTPTASITLYAVWEKTEYTASFRYNYYDNPVNAGNSGAVYEQKKYYYQDTVTAPETDPVREGYTFEGWYTLATNKGVKVEFPLTAGDSGANYYAHWKSNDVITDTFDAEYTDFDPTITWPGYSGGAGGNNCILSADVSGVHVDKYPMNSKRPADKGFYVTFQYLKDFGLTFEFYAKEDITGATLIANWAVELAGLPGQENYMTFGPTGDNAYEVALDGVPLDYTPARVGGPDESNGQFKSGFKEYTLMTGLNLSKGKHTITLIPRNNNSAFGAVLKSVAPMTDYIRIAYSGEGKLYWNPVYDNLDGKS